MSNEELIHEFYTAFNERDADRMVACYHDEIVFSDPAFGTLYGEKAGAMWRMLVERVGDDFAVRHHSAKTVGDRGEVHWEADYKFSQTNRQVYNKIWATFRFQDGKIIEHKDKFNLWRWTRMALGATGLFMGWTPIVQNKVRNSSRALLEKYMAKKS